MRRIIVKEGPLVFVRNVIIMEIVAAVFFYFVSFITNYEQFYRHSFLAAHLRYDIFLIVVFSLFQLFYISLLFLDWYFSNFEINDREVVRRSGLLFRKKKSVSLSQVATVETSESIVGRLINHATIILEHNNGRLTKMKNVNNAEEYVHLIKQIIESEYGRIISKDISRILEEGEGLFVEFKETLRYDTRKNEVSKEIEKMVLKTIVAFMNADGGTLIIGVNDEGQVTGLENDYKSIAKRNRDGFENHLNMLIKTMIGVNYTKYVGIKFEKIKDKELCIVSVKNCHKPAYLHNGDKKEDFYVRVGNSTQPFSMSEAEEYIKTHWK